MKHISYKDLSPDRYRKWKSERIKMLKRILRNPQATEKQKQQVTDKIKALSNKSLIE